MMSENKLILIVDDEDTILFILKRKLEQCGFVVETAQNGQEGLDKARSLNPDLIILDVMLPGIDGYKICQMLKFDEDYSEIPIILLTARNQEEDRKMGLQTGANRYLTKTSASDFWENLIENVNELIN
jgi:DNA-binding response OmpR family regulator